MSTQRRKKAATKAAERFGRMQASKAQPAEKRTRRRAPPKPVVMTTMAVPQSLKNRLQRLKEKRQANRDDMAKGQRVQLWAIVVEALEALERERKG